MNLLLLSLLFGKPLLPVDPLGINAPLSSTTNLDISPSPTADINAPTPALDNPDDIQNTTIITGTPPETETENEIAMSTPTPSPTIIPQNITIVATCNTTATAYLTCVNNYMEKQGKTKFDQDSCANCKQQYIHMTSKCNDKDYMSDRLLFFSFMACHVEKGQNCGGSMEDFRCDDCGKFLSIKLVDYDILDNMSDTLSNGQDMNKAQYQKCSGRAKIRQKSSSFVSNVNIETMLIYLIMTRSAIPFAELEDENEEEEHIEIEATGVRSSSAKKAKRQDQKQKYKEYKQHLIQKQKLEQERQDMLIQEKRLVENKLTKFDNEWFKETENDRKLVEIEVEIKGDMNNIVSYIQRRDIVYFEELEILFFHSKSEISKMVDLWISTGVILASRNDNIITIL